MKKILLAILVIFIGNLCFAADPVKVDFNDGIYHITVTGDKIKKKIKFISSESLITNSEAHKANPDAILTINAGFFDPDNGKSISYIVTDSITSEDPHFNENLLNNPELRQNLTKILNRTEFRILECSSEKDLKYAIVPHNTSADFSCFIKTSAQGGPLILPQLRLEEEFFVVKKDGKVIRESASVLHKTARTIIGLKGDELHILIITDKHPMDLYEVQKYCKDLGLTRAMAFDGGSSTSFNYKDKIEVVSTEENSTGRSVKSFMQITK